jgi:hypothetical protein
MSIPKIDEHLGVQLVDNISSPKAMTVSVFLLLSRRIVLTLPLRLEAKLLFSLLPKTRDSLTAGLQLVKNIEVRAARH